MVMAGSPTNVRQEAADGVGIGIAVAIGGPLLALLAIGLFAPPPGVRLGLVAVIAVVASLGLGGALMSLGDFRSNPGLGDWGVAVILAGLGGVLVALTAFEVLGGVLGAAVTIVGFLLLLVALIGTGLGAAKCFAASPDTNSQEPNKGTQLVPTRTSKRERVGIVFAFLQTLGTFVGLFLQS